MWEEEEVGVVVTMSVKGWIGGGGCVVVVHGGFGVVVAKEAVKREKEERELTTERGKNWGETNFLSTLELDFLLP